MGVLKSILVDLVTKFLLLSISFTLFASFFKQPPVIPDFDITKCPPIAAKNNSKLLWAYWRDGAKSMSVFNQETFKMWKHMAPDWDIRLLHYQNPDNECHIHKFVPPNQLPRTFENLTAPLSSDAVRIAVMKLYGGVYMDVSIILLQNLEEAFWNRINLPRDDPKSLVLGGYYINDMNKPGRKTGYELWMQIAQANEPLMVAWHTLFLNILREEAVPFMRNETTGELNPYIKGAHLAHLSIKQMNYLCAAAMLQGLLDIRPDLNETWNKHVEPGLYNVEETAFRMLISLGFNSENFYKRMALSNWQTSWRFRYIAMNTPVVKFISHAGVYKDELYAEWSGPSNLLTKIRRMVVYRGINWTEHLARNHTYHHDNVILYPS